MVNDQLHIIMPVKDSIAIAERAIHSIVDCGYTLCVYDDNSLPENAQRLDKIAAEKHIQVVHVSSLTDHPSPNYRLVLQQSQQQALIENKHLLIVESDVIIKANTLNRMLEEVQKGVGMVAAVTVDEQGEYNFPYHYLHRLRYRFLSKKTIDTKKRFSFCCTLLTNELLKKATPWEQWGYVPVAETQWTMRRVVRAAMHRYNLQALLDTVKQNRCAEDFDDRYSTQKIDFIRKWYHTRTKHPQISLDEFQQAYAEEHNDTWWDVPDTQQDMEQTVVDCADADLFIQALDPKDLEILQLRNKGHSLEEIAQMLGYKTHSAVLKRIQKLGEKYQEFAGTDIGF